ncbi:cytosine permease [Protaetiibacter sp. SSC-01]|uniref:cytosine permease n=1 Tax=Protaetiibacter sp. SSC-01 TaxID=2759943 RepID=UPI001656957B|nr:cytosine permease [Protaetiibacter sp. SSC-01]QNO36474.1 cytosine permease [Protaetiibacter sp. SSC-01]
MTEVPGGEPPREDADGAAPEGAPAAAGYPPPYGAATPTVSDDELAAALAAQTAMYTGPITIPVLNSDPAFRPDPGQVQSDVPPPPAESAPEPVAQPDFAPEPAAPASEPPVAHEPALPPVPVPPPPPAPEYIAPDVVASDPEVVADAAPPAAEWPAPSEFTAPVDVTPAASAPPAYEASAYEAAPVPSYEAPAAPSYEPPAPAYEAPAVEVQQPTSEPPLADDDLSRTIEEEVAAGSTLDAILLLENELRRRQGLPPAEETSAPPAEVGAVFGAAAFAAAPTAAPPGWIDAPDPTREGESLDAFAAPAAETVAAPVWDLGPSQPTVAPSLPEPVEAPAADAPVYELPVEEPAPSAPAYELHVEASAAPATPAGDDQAWLSAPPPTFAPPPLVEPPAPAPVPLDATTLTPPPVSELPAPVLPPPVTTVDGPDGPVDVSQLPPPTAHAVDVAPAGFQDAPPPPAEAIVLTGAPAPYDADPDVEGIDPLDRADLPAPIPVDETGVASVAPVPLSTATVVAVGEPLAPEAPSDPPAMAVEATSVEPTPVEQRAGHAARLFWLWFAANSSIVTLAVGATLFAAGMSLRQALVAVVAGVALSALPLGLGSLAGKWSGQPTMVVSRATFGLVGNIVPAVLAVVGRVLWGGVLLWLLAATAGAMFAPGEGAGATAFVALAVGAVVAAIVAVLGYGLLHRVQRVLGILSTVLLIVVIGFTASHVDIEVALRTDDGSWLLALGGVVTVFSVVGLAWAQSSSDLARYQNPAGSGAANMLWGSFGAIVPTLAIISWGAVLAASDPELAGDLASAPLATLLDLVPAVVVIPLFAAAAFGLVAGAIVAIYSAGLALGATGLRAPRPVGAVIAAVLVPAVAAGVLLIGADTRDIVADIATTVAVPVAAWTGIFGAEMMIRLRRFHAPSLLAPGGVYPAVRWVNLVGLFVITAVGYGFTSAELAGFTWQGYLFGPLGVAAGDPLAGTDVGVLIALALGIVLPLVAGIPAIRRQERDREETDAAPAGTVAAPLVD